MNYKTNVFYLLFVLIVWSFTAKGQIRYLCSDQINEDVNYLVKSLEETSVNPYGRYSKKRFYDDIRRSKKHLIEKQNPTALEMYKEIQPIIVHLEDGHVELDLGSLLSEEDKIIFPFNLKISSNGLIVSDIKDGYHTKISPSLIGKKITKLNNISSKKILNLLNRYSSGESKITRIGLSAYYFNDFYNLLFKNGNNLKITFEDKTKLECILNTESTLKKTTVVEAQPPTYNYTYKINRDSSFALMTFDSFSRLEKFKVFAKEMFETLRNQKIENLIIDVRVNGGGNSSLGDELLKYLTAKPFTQYEKTVVKYSRLGKENFSKYLDKNDEYLKNYLSKENGSIATIDKSKILTIPVAKEFRYLGKVYLLTSTQTFSSAADFSNAFKFYKLGKIIGEETGGFVISPGDDFETQLPNSKINFTISSTKDFDVGATEKDWHGVFPDYKINSVKALDFIKNNLGY